MYCEFCSRLAPTCCVCGRNDLRHAPDQQTARFWVRVNGDWVKLSLKPGERVSHFTFQKTDEGFTKAYEKWSNYGGRVLWDWCEWGRDCDGGYDRGGLMACWVPALATNDMTDIDGPMCPSWDVADRWQRDESAELAGY